MLSLGNGGSSRKGYKMRCQSYPSVDLWDLLMKSKEKDTKYFFNVSLGPNPRTQQTTCIHGAGCNSEELRGICMFKVPRVLLRKRVMIGSLSRNLVCQLSSKRQVTHYPRVTKKEKQTWPTALTINQTNKVLLRAKRIHLYGVHLRPCLNLLLVALASGWLPSLSWSLQF